jgi:hypothetical protein
MYVCMSLSPVEVMVRAFAYLSYFFVCFDPSFTISETGIRGIFGDDCKNWLAMQKL